MQIPHMMSLMSIQHLSIGLLCLIAVSNWTSAYHITEEEYLKKVRKTKITVKSYGIVGKLYNAYLEYDPDVKLAFWNFRLTASHDRFAFPRSMASFMDWYPNFGTFSFLRWLVIPMAWILPNPVEILDILVHSEIPPHLRYDTQYGYHPYNEELFDSGGYKYSGAILYVRLVISEKLNFYYPIIGGLGYHYEYAHSSMSQSTLNISCDLLREGATPPAYATVHFSDGFVVEQELPQIYVKKQWFLITRENPPSGQLSFTVTVQDSEFLDDPDVFMASVYIVRRLEGVEFQFKQVSQVSDDGFLHKSPFLVNLPIDLTIVSTGTAEFAELYMDDTPYPVEGMNTTLEFSESGAHGLRVIVGNQYGNITLEESVIIVKPITNMVVLNSGRSAPDEDVALLIFAEDIGHKTIFSFDFGDGSPPFDFSWPSLDADVDGFEINFPFDPAQQRRAVFTHAYDTQGEYTVTFSGQGATSAAVSTTQVTVQAAACPPPSVHIRGGTEVASFSRFKEITLTSQVSAECRDRKAVTSLWEAYQVEDSSSLPADGNIYTLDPSIDVTSTTFTIPSFTLGYGSFIFQLTVSVINTVDVATSASDMARVEIKKSPLLPMISGGSVRAVGWNQTIVFDGSESRDPDDIDPHHGIVFQWFCRQANETFPEDLSPDSAMEKGGCLGSGLFLSNKTVWNMPHASLRGNKTYTVRLLLSKDGRSSIHSDQTLSVLPGDPPTIELRCLKNCGGEMNPSEKLILSGKCTDCTFYTRPQYWWTFKSREGNEKQDIDWRTDATTHRRNAYLSIKANTFLDSPYAEEYTFRLTITSWSGAVSFAEYTFTVNQAPSMGTCRASPTTGIVLQTKFTISCSDFSDPNKPLKYEFSASTGTEHNVPVTDTSSATGSLLYYGLDSEATDLLLPLGLASNDYVVRIDITVFDSYGVGVSTHVNVTVNDTPKEVTEETNVEDTVLSLTTGEDSELDKLLESGDSQSVFQFIGVVTSLLNTEAEKEAHTTHHSVPGDDDAGHSSDDQTSTEVHDSGQDQKMQQRIQIREAMLDSLARETVTSLEGVQQQSAAITQITKEESEVSVDAQTTATSALKEMADFLKDQSKKGVSSETIKQASSTVVAALDHIFDAAHLHATENATLDSDLSSDDDSVQKSRNISAGAVSALNSIMDAILESKVPGEKATVMKSHSVSMLFDRQELYDIGGTTLSSGSDIEFNLPSNDVIFHTMNSESVFDTVVDMKVQHFNSNPFHWTRNSSQVTSSVSSLEFAEKDGAGIAVRDLEEPIRILLPHSDGDAFTPHEIYTMAKTSNLTFLNVSMDDPHAAVLFEVRSQDAQWTEIEMYLQFESEPSLRSYDYFVAFPRTVNSSNSGNAGNISADLEYTWISQPSERFQNGKYVVGVRVGGDEVMSTEDVSVNVSLSVYQVVCRYWNETEETWLTDGCKVAADSTIRAIRCECNHLSFFGTSIFVAPYEINFAEDIALFLTIADNPIMLGTLITIFVVFLLCAILARRKDISNAAKREVVVLEDNDPLARINYQVTIFTGVRRGAGTSATVSLTISGAWEDSDCHVLNPADGNRRVLQTGSRDCFLVRTHRYLGNLQSVRLWHDNAGSSPGWFVSRIVVENLETGIQWYFLCKSWISTQSGSIDRTFLVATPEELSSFQHLFVTRTVQDFRDGHLWFSIFSRPAYSQFNCLQRVSCCLSLLLCTMLAGLMFYGVTVDPSQQEIDFGHFRMTITEIMIGIQSGLVTVPINIAIVQIFRNLRPRISTASWKQQLMGLQSLCFGETDGGDNLNVSVHTSNQGDNDDGVSGGGDFGQSGAMNESGDQVGKSSSERSLSERESKPSEERHTSSTAQDIKNRVDQGVRSSDEGSAINVESIKISETESGDSQLSSLDALLQDGHKAHVSKKLQQTLDRLEEMSPADFRSPADYALTKWKLQKMLSLQSEYVAAPQKFYNKGKDLVENFMKRNQSGFFPWWFVYVGWILVALTCLASAFFILWYGLKYGRQKSIDWLVSMGVSLFQSVFCVQPFKVIFLAMIVSSLFGTNDDQVTSEIEKSSKYDATVLEGDIDSHISRLKHIRQAPQYHPPPQAIVRQAAKELEKQKRVNGLVKEMLVSVILLFLITTIAFNLVSPNAIHWNNVLGNTLADGFDEIGAYEDIFDWMNDALLPGLYGPEEDYLGADSSATRLLGSARLRQVRIKADSCQVHETLASAMKNCLAEYSDGSEDRQSYSDSWDGGVVASVNQSNKWHYQSSDGAQGSYFVGNFAVYGRGGYMADLGTALEEASRVVQEVYESSWIDDRSRALYVELTVYNVDANLIAVVTFLLELPATGGVFPSYELITTKYYKRELLTNIFILICEILYVIITGGFIFIIVSGIHQQKLHYFCSLWNLLDVLEVLCSLASISIYIYHLTESVNTIAKYKSNQRLFTSFYNVAFSYQALNITSAYVVFIATVKLGKMLRTNSSVYLVQRTFQLVYSHLIAFSFMIGYVIYAFCQFAYVVFGNKIPEYSTMISSAESLLGFLLGQFDLSELNEQYRLIGPTMFVLLIFIVYFIMAPMYTMLMISAFLETSTNRTYSEDSDTFLALLSQLTCGKLKLRKMSDKLSAEPSDLTVSVDDSEQLSELKSSDIDFQEYSPTEGSVEQSTLDGSLHS